jgi:hypothetical protein
MSKLGKKREIKAGFREEESYCSGGMLRNRAKVRNEMADVTWISLNADADRGKIFITENILLPISSLLYGSGKRRYGN